jgi:hypothetical protein
LRRFLRLVLVVGLLSSATIASPVAGGTTEAPLEDVPAATQGRAPLKEVSGHPDIEVAAPNNRLRPSERTRLTVLVSNGGHVSHTGPSGLMETVTTAKNVRLSVVQSELNDAIEVKSGTVMLSALPTGRPGEATFALETSDALEPGTYRVPIEVTYDYTDSVVYRVDPSTGSASIVDTDENWVSERYYVTVVVDESAQFEVVTEQSEDVYAGDTGRLDVSIRNTGSATARDATVKLESKSPLLFFGSPERPQQNTSVYPSTLEPGATYNASVKVGATGEATPGSYPVSAQVVYENANDVPGVSDAMSLGVTVRAERSFARR